MERPAPRHRRLRLALAATAFLAIAFGCVVDAPDGAPRHGWAKRYGPVIPHDTFPRDCTLCHEGSGWKNLRADFAFDHAAETGYALTGAHAAAQCLRCHNDRGPVQVFSQRGCAGCHVDVHRGNLGADCAKCHGDSDWRAVGELGSHAATRFPLVGAHVATACWRCHPNAQAGNFQGADPECLSCHSRDYAAAKEPNHAAGGFATTCQDCHGAVSWKPARFDHAGITSNCVSCHLADYQGTTAPNHQVAGFTTACESCHFSTKQWQVATFDHPFPIKSGAHNGFGCTQCHLNPTTFMVFSCTHCHAHAKPTADAQHAAVPDYAWVSTACLLCHPDGTSR